MDPTGTQGPDAGICFLLPQRNLQVKALHLFRDSSQVTVSQRLNQCGEGAERSLFPPLFTHSEHQLLRGQAHKPQLYRRSKADTYRMAWSQNKRSHCGSPTHTQSLPRKSSALQSSLKSGNIRSRAISDRRKSHVSPEAAVRSPCQQGAVSTGLPIHATARCSHAHTHTYTLVV